MIAEQIGGPWGAAIGAAAGFTAGMTEKLLGIESPPRKAHDDIKSIYGVDIPQNSGTIKQVVQIAQSQFGGDIAVAVRSPSVRQLVMLYSEATGQKMPLSATTPYGVVQFLGFPERRANAFRLLQPVRRHVGPADRQ